MIKISKTIAADTYHAILDKTTPITKQEFYINLSGFESSLELDMIYKKIVLMIKEIEDEHND